MPKLLIVDDEIDVREFAKNFFQRRKIKVLTAASGEEALGLLDKEKPDLVLLDIRMEGMDGVAVLEEMRQRKDNTEVIMVTGISEELTMKRAKELGVIDYIHKPLVLDELEKIVMSRLQKQK